MSAGPDDGLPETHKAPEGINGKLDSPAVLLFEGGQAVLSVGYEFDDVPSWVEWDAHTRKISIAQMGGAMAELGIYIPEGLEQALNDVRNLLLITDKGGRKLIHYIAFLIRN